MTGHGWIVDTSELFQQSGWLVKNLGLRSSLFQTIRYQLSHAGILPLAKGRVATITWFGALSYNKLHVVHIEERDVCETCGRELVIMDFESGFDPPFEGRLVTFEEARIAGMNSHAERYQAI
jgi:hypothetical protein